MGGFSTIVGLTKLIADTLYDTLGAATSAINDHKVLTTAVHGIRPTVEITTSGTFDTTPTELQNIIDQSLATSATEAKVRGNGSTIVEAYITCNFATDKLGVMLVKLTSASGGASNAGTVTLETSPDNAAWTTLATGAGGTGALGVYIAEKYVRIKISVAIAASDRTISVLVYSINTMV